MIIHIATRETICRGWYLQRETWMEYLQHVSSVFTDITLIKKNYGTDAYASNKLFARLKEERSNVPERLT
jgi:hypothetical protein